jgi:MATE family multidrug resistance protein
VIVVAAQAMSEWRKSGFEARTLLALAWPISVAQLALMLLNLVDTAVVGRHSVDALAGASLGRNIAWPAQSLALGLAIVPETLASQALGAKRPGEAWSSYVAAIRFSLFMAPLSIAITFALVQLLGAIGIEDAVVREARAFVWGFIPSQVAFGVFSASRAFLQAHGAVRHALYAAIAGNVVNAVACVCLVLGDPGLVALHLPPMGFVPRGAFGAGLASSIGSVFLASWLAVVAYQHRAPVPANERVGLALIAKLGLPLGFQLLAEMGAISLASVLAGRFGAQATAANQICLGLASFTFMGALGVSGGTAVRVGHAVGEGSDARLRGRVGIVVGSSLMLFGSVLFATAPLMLARLFTNDDAVLELSVSLLRIAALFQFFDGMQVVSAGALRGIGDVRFPLVANLFAHWVVGLPSAWVFAHYMHLGVRGLWFGLSLGLFTAALLLALRFEVLSKRPAQRLVTGT